MKGKTGRGNLFLIEIILGILFFSIAAAVCVQLFVKAHTLGTGSTDLNRSVTLAQTAAETFRACAGSLPETAQLLSASEQGEDTYLAYYDQQGKPCGKEEAIYIVSLQPGEKEAPLSSGIITVTREEKTLYTLETDFAAAP